MDFITVSSPECERYRYELRDPRLRIGRSSANELILKDPNVSRQHAEIEQRPDGFYLLDAGGKNGTLVNDRRITEPTLLRRGDRIRIGTTTLIFCDDTSSQVEFSDQPLPRDSATTSLKAHEIHTPAAGLPATSPFLSLILEADQELVFHRPEQELLESIMDLAARAAPYEVGVLGLLEGGEIVSKVVRVPARESGRTVTISRTIADHVIKKQESVRVGDARVDERFRKGESIAAQQIRSAMCVPLWDNREVIGLIYVDSRAGTGLYNEETLRLLAHLANVAAVKIENARLFARTLEARMYEEELEKAAEIQSRLMPGEGPQIAGYGVDGSSHPCQAVGGDYYDYLSLPGGRVGIALGDVAGKGLPASLLMCRVCASVRALADLDLPLEDLIKRLNRLICRDIPSNRFVTFFCGFLDVSNHTLTYINAGHNPPLLVRHGGKVERLSVSGPPIGLFENLHHDARTVALRPGDLLICYSDGVTEAEDRKRREFGEDHLIRTVLECRLSKPAEIVRRVIDEVNAHYAGLPPQDDITLVVLKRAS